MGDWSGNRTAAAGILQNHRDSYLRIFQRSVTNKQSVIFVKSAYFFYAARFFIFGQSNAFINQQYNSAIQVSNATVYTQGNWGFTGNIVPGIYVASGANVTLGGGDTVMGTQGGLQFLQTIYSWANLPSYIVSRDTFTKLTTGSTSANDILNSNGTVQVTANTPIAVSYPTITASNVVLLSLRVGIGNTLTPSVTVQPGTGFTVASYYGDTSTYAWVVL